MAFDPLQYAAANPDLARAFGTNKAALTWHYEAAGIREGRATTFDYLQYAAANVDVFRAAGKDSDALLSHYILYGMNEARKITFDALQYGASNVDLARVIGANPSALLDHYLDYGVREGRATTGFDPLLYGASYGDLARALGANKQALLEHYLGYGAREGRAPVLFDPLAYGASNVDLARVLGADEAALTLHYLQYGINEGRATSGFDALEYAAANLDLAHIIGNNPAALREHYLFYGADEGRATSGFDSVAYLLSNPDLLQVGLTPAAAFQHWITYGAKEGRNGEDFFGREQTSHSIAVGQQVNSSIEKARDTDWFALQLTAGQKVIIDLERQGTLGGLSDSYLRIYDPNNNLVAEDNDSGSGTDAFVALTAATSGTYYIVPLSFGANGIGNYTLSVTANETDFRTRPDTLQISSTTPGNVSGLSLLDNDNSSLGALSIRTVLNSSGTTANAGQAIIGTLGTLTIQPFGSYSFSLANTAQIRDLQLGQTLSETFSYTAGVGTALAPPETLTVTVSGALYTTPGNTFSGILPSNGPAGQMAVSGYATNFGVQGTLGQPLAGQYGSLTVTAAGNLQYMAFNTAALQALTAGGSVSETFTLYRMGGGVATASPFTVTVRGVNDAPVANSESASTAEGAAPNAVSRNLLANDTDPDPGTSLTISAVSGGSVGQAVQGKYGSVVISANGTAVYTLDNNDPDTVALGSGQSGFESFIYTVSDGALSSSATFAVTVNGTGPVTITGTDEGNMLQGTNANDLILGLGGDDTIFGSMGADEIDGGTGNDLVWYIFSGEGVQADLTGALGVGGQAQGDRLINIERLFGSSFGDRLIGNSNNNTLIGDDGDDVISGDAGDDQIDGGSGADTIDGGSGSDLVTYQGSPVGIVIDLDAGTGLGGFAEGDVLNDVEVILGTNFNDVFIDAVGSNAYNGVEGFDAVSFARATEGAFIDLALGTAYNNSGLFDRLFAIDRVIATPFDDVVNGSMEADELLGGDGADKLNGIGGADTLTGGSGSDEFMFDLLLLENGQADTITDFEKDVDRLIMWGGDIDQNFTFIAGANPVAAGSDATYLYNTTTGLLSYSVPAGGLREIAYFPTLPVLDASDITSI